MPNTEYALPMCTETVHCTHTCTYDTICLLQIHRDIHTHTHCLQKVSYQVIQGCIHLNMCAVRIPMMMRERGIRLLDAVYLCNTLDKVVTYTRVL